MPDFACALYLGMRHPSAALGSWDELTLGVPAALREPPGAGALAVQLARLAGFEAATLLPSTLHLFRDLMAMLAAEPIVLLVDDACYPVALWAAQSVAGAGTPLCLFPHGTATGALRLARAAALAGRRPVLVADTCYPGADKLPPLRAYANIARATGGYLVLDDTQPFGVFGRAPRPAAPYGSGGGGSACRHGLHGPHVIVGASLAKGFGAPLAVLCASGALVGRFEEHSAARVHSSPPSVAAIHAALAALQLNRGQGEHLRTRLWRLVTLWRSALARRGIQARGGSFPVQTLALAPQVDGALLHRDLERAGVFAVPQRWRARATVSFLITASHTDAEIERAVEVLARCLRRQGASDNAIVEAL